MSRLGHVTIDLTPLGSSGQNGGAGLVAASLVRNLSALRPDLRLTLLTSEASHGELAALDADNTERLCVGRKPGQEQRGLRVAAKRMLDRLPPALRIPLKNTYQQVRHGRARAQLVRGLQSDLLFCPFTAPYFYDPATPMVSIIYDLQHESYPEFFTPEQRAFRRQHIREACAVSARVTCISDFVRQAVLNSVNVPPERVLSVPLGLLDEYVVSASPDAGILERLGLRASEFVLYPANFWPHKNHGRLFQALREFGYRHPESRLKLVCTGAPNTFMRDLEATTQSILPPGVVIFAGYRTAAEVRALLQACRALVFPSLYEGFGMPVLEAMAVGKPVLCSNTASLPEVAGDAAVYFDPTEPAQIADALERLEQHQYIAALVERGRARATRFGTARDMAGRYCELFETVVAESHA